MKNIKFIALAFTALFIATSITSCSHNEYEAEAKELIEYIKEGDWDEAKDYWRELRREFKDEEGGYDTDEFKKLLEAIDNEAASEGVIIPTTIIIAL